MLLDTVAPTTAAPAAPVIQRSSLRDSLYRIGAVARHNVIIRKRDPGQMISYVVMPMILMLVLKPLYERAVDGGALQVVTGFAVMFSVFAIAIAGNSILVERHWHTWDRLRQTRATSHRDADRQDLPLFVVMFVQQSLLVIYGSVVIGIPMPHSVGLVAAGYRCLGVRAAGGGRRAGHPGPQPGRAGRDLRRGRHHAELAGRRAGAAVHHAGLGPRRRARVTRLLGADA